LYDANTFKVPFSSQRSGSSLMSATSPTFVETDQNAVVGDVALRKMDNIERPLELARVLCRPGPGSLFSTRNTRFLAELEGRETWVFTVLSSRQGDQTHRNGANAEPTSTGQKDRMDGTCGGRVLHP